MKILQIFPRFPWPLKDGGALAFYAHLKGLKDNGHEVTCAVLNTSKHHVQLDKIPNEVKSLADFHLFDIHNHITPWGAFKNLFQKKSYILSRFYVEAFEPFLFGLIQNTQPETIIFESLQTAAYLPFVRSCSKATCLLRSHNIECSIWEEQAKLEKNPIKAAYLALQAARLKQEELILSQQFDGILAITQADALQYKQHGVSVPCWYYPVGFYPRAQSMAPVGHQAKVFHLGSMDWMPNQAAVSYFLEQVWPLVQTENPNLCFEIAGRNMPESFKNIQQPGVRVIGEVDNADHYMRENGLLVIPLLSGSGMRVKVMEGMALGKCIISTSKGMEGIEATPAKHFVLANTPLEFKEAIIFYTNNLHEADKIGAEARKFALETFENSRIVKQLEQFIHQIVNN